MALLVAFSCGKSAPATHDASVVVAGSRLVVVPGTPGRIHAQLHLAGLASADGMMFALGSFEVRAPGGGLVARIPEALSAYLPATPSGDIDLALDLPVEPRLLPGRYEFGLTITDVIGGRRIPLQAAADIAWPGPEVPSGFGLRSVGKGAAAGRVHPGDEVTLRFEAFGFRVAPSDLRAAVWLETDLELLAPGSRTVLRRHQGTYREPGPFTGPVLDLVYRVRVPPDAKPGTYAVRLSVTDRLGGYHTDMERPLEVIATPIALGPPRWGPGTEAGWASLAVRLSTAAGEGLDLQVRIVGADGTVVAVAASPARIAHREDGVLLEARVNVDIPAGFPKTPLKLSTTLLEPGASPDAGVLHGEWPIPPSPDGSSAKSALRLIPANGKLAAGGALPFTVVLTRPPAPVQESEPPVRLLAVVFGVTASGPDGGSISKGSSTVTASVPFVPGEASVEGLWVTASDFAAGIYHLRAEARSAAAEEIWTAEVAVEITR